MWAGVGLLLGCEADWKMCWRWNFVTSEVIFDQPLGPQLRSSPTASPQGADAEDHHFSIKQPTQRCHQKVPLPPLGPAVWFFFWFFFLFWLHTGAPQSLTEHHRRVPQLGRSQTPSSGAKSQWDIPAEGSCDLVSCGCAEVEPPKQNRSRPPVCTSPGNQRERKSVGENRTVTQRMTIFVILGSNGMVIRLV